MCFAFTGRITTLGVYRKDIINDLFIVSWLTFDFLIISSSFFFSLLAWLLLHSPVSRIQILTTFCTMFCRIFCWFFSRCSKSGFRTVCCYVYGFVHEMHVKNKNFLWKNEFVYILIIIIPKCDRNQTCNERAITKCCEQTQDSGTFNFLFDI